MFGFGGVHCMGAAVDPAINAPVPQPLSFPEYKDLMQQLARTDSALGLFWYRLNQSKQLASIEAGTKISGEVVFLTHKKPEAMRVIEGVQHIHELDPGGFATFVNYSVERQSDTELVLLIRLDDAVRAAPKLVISPKRAYKLSFARQVASVARQVASESWRLGAVKPQAVAALP